MKHAPDSETAGSSAGACSRSSQCDSPESDPSWAIAAFLYVALALATWVARKKR